MKDPLARLNDTVRAVSKAFENPDLVAFIDAANRLPQEPFKQMEESVQRVTRQWADVTRTLNLPLLQSLAQTQAVADAMSSVLPSIDWLPPDPTSAVMQRYAERTRAHFDAIFRSSTFASPAVLLELQRLRPIIEEQSAAILAAPDEPTRRLRLAEILQTYFQWKTGIDPRLDSPEAVSRVKIMMVFLLIQFLVNIYAHRVASLAVSRERQDHRRIEQAQAESIATIAEAVRELQEHVAVLSNAPQAQVRVTRRASLREGPSATTRRVSTLKTGERLKLLTTVGRWHYVEVISADHDTVTRGWIYRRNVRVVAP